MPPLAAPPRRIVLVVDDQAVLRNVLRDVLQHGGFDVVEASGRESALQQCREHELALAVIDVGLPSVSGLDLSRHLRDVRPRLPVIFMSGFPATDLPDLGGAPFLQKPFGSAELIDLVRHQLRDGA